MQIRGMCYQKESLRFFPGFLELGKIVDIIQSTMARARLALTESHGSKVELEFCGLKALERVTW